MAGDLFHVGLRPIELIVRFVYVSLLTKNKSHSQFCMADLLQIKKKP